MKVVVDLSKKCEFEVVHVLGEVKRKDEKWVLTGKSCNNLR